MVNAKPPATGLVAPKGELRGRGSEPRVIRPGSGDALVRGGGRGGLVEDCRRQGYQVTELNRGPPACTALLKRDVPIVSRMVAN